MFEDATAVTVEIGGASPGAGYTQYVIDGPVIIGVDVTLDVSLVGGFEPSAMQFIIVANDGTDPVQGTFADLDDGDTIRVAGHLLTIDYQGGDGNDIALTTGSVILGTNGADIVDATQTVPGQPLPTSDGDIIKGRGGNDLLDGGAGDDVLNGGTGDDRLIGGLGNDRFRIDSQGDQVIETTSGGFDRAYTTVDYALAAGIELEILHADPGALGLTLTGNELDNRLVGGAGADTLIGGLGNDGLNGGSGADTLVGGAGDDRYYIDDFGDDVIEAVGGGFDRLHSTVNYVLADGQEIEVLRVAGADGLVLTGNDLDNFLIGGSGADELHGGSGGNDRLSGRGGNDILSMMGQSAEILAGAGDDSIRLDGSSTSTGTVDGGSGTDTVHSADLGEMVLRNVEVLDTYYGFTNGTVAQIASFGSYTADLADPDAQISFSLRGGGGTLDFTAGISGQNSVEIRDAGLTSAIQVTGSVNADRLFGSNFDDRLNGGNGDDVLLAGDGRDRLVGGANDDRLNGGTGNDVLTGGAGDDTFIFDSPIAGGTNIDRITDFAPGSDIIEIDEDYVFAGLTLGQLDPAQFAVGSATGTGPQIVYNGTTGALFYDSNGAEAGGASKFAIVVGAPLLTASDFLVV